MNFLRKIWLRALHWRRTAVESCDRAAVLEHVASESALAPRYAFMTVLSSGIATLGLLQNSVAVIIGAMLISPLMGPIVELGMGLATFASGTVRRALGSLGVGIGLAALTAVAIVWFSPLKDATSEIIARTDPTLFDLLIAVFSGLAGAYATITRKGETIVGVAIATALMPPLAVAGYGLALQNPHIAGGAFFLFMTNLLAIALSVTIVARIYGFKGTDSPKQSVLQAILVIGIFVVLSVPLGLALRKIVVRTQVERTVRAVLEDNASHVGGRVTTLRVDSSINPLLVDAVFMTPRFVPELDSKIQSDLQTQLRRDTHVELREVVTTNDDTDALRRSTLADLQKSVEDLQSAATAERDARRKVESRDQRFRDAMLAQLGTLQSLDDGTIPRMRLRAGSGIDLAGARAMEKNVGGANAETRFQVIPPLQPLLRVLFDHGQSDLTGDGLQAAEVDAWALKRWNATSVTVTGHAPDWNKVVATKRAQAVAKLLEQRGIVVDLINAETTSRRKASQAPSPDRVDIEVSSQH